MNPVASLMMVIGMCQWDLYPALFENAGQNFDILDRKLLWVSARRRSSLGARFAEMKQPITSCRMRVSVFVQLLSAVERSIGKCTTIKYAKALCHFVEGYNY